VQWCERPPERDELLIICDVPHCLRAWHFDCVIQKVGPCFLRPVFRTVLRVRAMLGVAPAPAALFSFISRRLRLNSRSQLALIPPSFCFSSLTGSAALLAHVS
jgi:hypothetical protein